MFILLGSFSIFVTLKPIHEVMNTSAKYQRSVSVQKQKKNSFQNGLIINIQNVFKMMILICMNCRTEMNALNYQTYVESE